MGLEDKVSKIVNDLKSEQNDKVIAFNKAFQELVNFENNVISPLAKEYASIMRKHKISFVNKNTNLARYKNPHEFYIDLLNDKNPVNYEPIVCSFYILVKKNGSWEYNLYNNNFNVKKYRIYIAEDLTRHSSVPRRTYSEVEEIFVNALARRIANK